MCVCGDAFEQWQASETAEGATTTQASHPSIRPLVAAMPGMGSSQFTHSTDPAPTWQGLSSETRAHSHTTRTRPRPHAHMHTLANVHTRTYKPFARMPVGVRATACASALLLHACCGCTSAGKHCHTLSICHMYQNTYICTHNHESLPAGSMAACIAPRHAE